MDKLLELILLEESHRMSEAKPITLAEAGQLMTKMYGHPDRHDVILFDSPVGLITESGVVDTDHDVASLLVSPYLGDLQFFRVDPTLTHLAKFCQMNGTEASSNIGGKFPEDSRTLYFKVKTTDGSSAYATVKPTTADEPKILHIYREWTPEEHRLATEYDNIHRFWTIIADHFRLAITSTTPKELRRYTLIDPKTLTSLEVASYGNRDNGGARHTIEAKFQSEMRATQLADLTSGLSVDSHKLDGKPINGNNITTGGKVFEIAVPRYNPQNLMAYLQRVLGQ